jgi:hypothetical protein
MVSCFLLSLLQAVMCMLAFFTIFWWNGVPLSAVYNHGSTYWMFPDSAPDLSFNCV